MSSQHTSAVEKERADGWLDKIYREMAKLDPYMNEEEMREALPEWQLKPIANFWGCPSNGEYKNVEEVASQCYRVFEEAFSEAMRFGNYKKPISDVYACGNRLTIWVAEGQKQIVFERENGTII